MTYTCIFCQTKSKVKNTESYGKYSYKLHNFPCSPDRNSVLTNGHYYNLLTNNDKVIRENIKFKKYRVTYYYDTKQVSIWGNSSLQDYYAPYTGTFDSSGKMITSEQVENFLLLG